jgi:phosphoribosylformylglycinamidine synthase subunit PurL
VRGDCFLFGESQSRIVISVKKADAAAFESFLKKENCAHTKLGQVIDNQVVIDGQSWGKVAAWMKIWDEELGLIMG